MAIRFFFFETNTHEYNLILTNNYFEFRNKYYYPYSWPELFILFTFVSKNITIHYSHSFQRNTPIRFLWKRFSKKKQRKIHVFRCFFIIFAGE